MHEREGFVVRAIGVVRSPLRAPEDAPNQAFAGAPEAVLEIDPALTDALHRVLPGDELIVLTWLHQADRSVLQVHPMGDQAIPLTGVFRTRSPARPNPIGIHRVTVTTRDAPTQLRVGALEAIDGTPIIDLKRWFLNDVVARRGMRVRWQGSSGGRRGGVAVGHAEHRTPRGTQPACTQTSRSRHHSDTTSKVAMSESPEA